MIWHGSVEVEIASKRWATTQTPHKSQFSLGEELASLASSVLKGTARNVEIRQLEDADHDTGEPSKKVLTLVTKS